MAKLSRSERISRLKKHLEALKNGRTVSKRDMQSLLDPHYLEMYEQLWHDEKEHRQSIIDGRYELATYNEKLKKADAIWTRYENTANANKKSDTELAALSAYERALEHLEELLDRNPAIETYLDRTVSFAQGREVNPGPDSVPRYLLSKSHHTLEHTFTSKQDLKIQVIQDALQHNLAPPTRPKLQVKERVTSTAQTLRQFTRRL